MSEAVPGAVVASRLRPDSNRKLRIDTVQQLHDLRACTLCKCVHEQQAAKSHACKGADANGIADQDGRCATQHQDSIIGPARQHLDA